MFFIAVSARLSMSWWPNFEAIWSLMSWCWGSVLLGFLLIFILYAVFCVAEGCSDWTEPWIAEMTQLLVTKPFAWSWGGSCRAQGGKLCLEPLLVCTATFLKQSLEVLDSHSMYQVIKLAVFFWCRSLYQILKPGKCLLGIDPSNVQNCSQKGCIIWISSFIAPFILVHAPALPRVAKVIL